MLPSGEVYGKHDNFCHHGCYVYVRSYPRSSSNWPKPWTAELPIDQIMRRPRRGRCPEWNPEERGVRGGTVLREVKQP